MARPRHLGRAPITEAVLDLQVKLRANLQVVALKAAHDSIRTTYPEILERRKWSSSVQLSKNKPPAQAVEESGPDGYLFRSSDSRQLVQFRLDGFTFNRFSPYESWELMRTEALRLWEVYRRVASPELVTRVALRYINNLQFQPMVSDLRAYLTAPPSIPGQLPHFVTSFLTRIVILDATTNAAANISQVLESISKGNIILDIDVFKGGQFAADGNEVWELLDALRDFKNRIFFESVTDTTLDLYE